MSVENLRRCLRACERLEIRDSSVIIPSTLHITWEEFRRLFGGLEARCTLTDRYVHWFHESHGVTWVAVTLRDAAADSRYLARHVPELEATNADH